LHHIFLYYRRRESDSFHFRTQGSANFFQADYIFLLAAVRAWNVWSELETWTVRIEVPNVVVHMIARQRESSFESVASAVAAAQTASETAPHMSPNDSAQGRKTAVERQATEIHEAHHNFSYYNLAANSNSHFYTSRKSNLQRLHLAKFRG